MLDSVPACLAPVDFVRRGAGGGGGVLGGCAAEAGACAFCSGGGLRREKYC
jgi:hypothetical protein